MADQGPAATSNGASRFKIRFVFSVVYGFLPVVSQYGFLVALNPKTLSEPNVPEESNTVHPQKTSFGLLPLKPQALYDVASLDTEPLARSYQAGFSPARLSTISRTIRACDCSS